MHTFNRTHLSILLFFVACLALNCTPKAKPASSGNSSSSSSSSSTSSSSSSGKFEDLNVDQKIAAISNLSDGQYNSGMTTYQAKCGKCHKLFEPKSRDIGGWLRILKPMSKKADLSDQEYREVAGYLYNNCQK